VNLYGFVGNSSINRIDYLGQNAQPSTTPSGNSPVKLVDFNPDYNCAITIIVAHYPTSHHAMKKVLESIKDGGNGELTCAKMSALSCHPDKNKEQMNDKIHENGFQNLGNIFFEIPYEVNQDGFLTNKHEPWREQLATAAFEMARRNGKEEAKKLCRKCRCACPTITVRFYLVGEDSSWSNNYITNFSSENWKPYFKDITVKCPEIED
jgi:hypothetical protein